MQNEIYDEKNGLTYMLCGDYYLPELALTDIEPTYGKYGMLRKSYLQEHRKAKYQILFQVTSLQMICIMKKPNADNYIDNEIKNSMLTINEIK